MIFRPVTYYLDGRLYEWVMGSAMTIFGLGMLVWPKMSHGSILQILEAMFNGTILGVLFFFIGILRLAALVANGNSMWIGPRIRSVSASIAAIFWTTFTLSMARVSLEQGFPSPMVFYWGMFTLAEVYISYRAALDVRIDS